MAHCSDAVYRPRLSCRARIAVTVRVERHTRLLGEGWCALDRAQLRAIVDASGRWQELATDFAKLIGVSYDSQPTGDMKRVVHPDSHAVLRGVIEGTRPHPHSFGCQLVTASGATLWRYVQAERHVVRNDDGTVQGVHLTTMEPVRAPSQTVIREERFRDFFANSFDAALITRARGRDPRGEPSREFDVRLRGR